MMTEYVQVFLYNKNENERNMEVIEWLEVMS